MNPHDKIFNDHRTYTVFDNIWTQIFTEKIWEAQHLPCKWSFKHHKFYSQKNNKGTVFSFDARCTDKKSQCGNILNARCIKLPANPKDYIEIQITTSDTRSIAHNEKRKIAGNARKEGKKDMKNIAATLYCVKKANKIMNDSDPVPAHLPNEATVRKMQQENKDDYFELERYPGSPIISLHKIKEENHYIRLISTSPFVIHMLTDNQIKLYHQALELEFFRISIDASGFSKIFEIDEGFKTNAIYMYEITIKIENKISSIGAMLSEAHDTGTISEWFSRWLKLVEKRPKYIVADGSLALLNALTLSLHKLSYAEYIEQCFETVREFDETGKVNKDKNFDVTVFRDRNHIIKNVRNWKCFDQCKDWRVKDFYTRIVGYTLNIRSLKLFQQTITETFIVCNSDTIDSSSNAEKALKSLM